MERGPTARPLAYIEQMAVRFRPLQLDLRSARPRIRCNGITKKIFDLRVIRNPLDYGITAPCSVGRLWLTMHSSQRADTKPARMGWRTTATGGGSFRTHPPRNRKQSKGLSASSAYVCMSQVERESYFEQLTKMHYEQSSPSVSPACRAVVNWERQRA